MTAAGPASGLPGVAARAAPALAVEGLTLSLAGGGGAPPLVRDLSFSVGPGETLAVVGESGSGKSLTALAVMRLLPPGVAQTAGRVSLAGHDLTALREREMRRVRGDRVAMIFQEPMTSLNPVLTVGRQLTEAIEAHESVGAAEAQARALAALDAVRISEPGRRLRQHPHELSGGMRQRVMIAMALALKPDVLIADEPTTALDATVQREVLDLLRDLQRDHGAALVLITHDMGVAAAMADRALVMEAGRSVETGPVAALFRAPREPYTRALLAAVPRMGAARPAKPPPGQVVARVADLTVRYDVRGGAFSRVTHHVHAVEGVSFSIRQGETYALVGESGCGKSTIAKAMAGLVPFEGEIEIDGLRIDDPRTAKAARRAAQIVFQDPMAALDPRMRAGDLVAEPLAIHGVGTPAERRVRAAELFERVGLSPEQLDRYPHAFSGGQRQRICIARALALGPKLIVADECVSALDVSVQARVLALLRRLGEELGVAYLFISHDMAVVDAIADRVGVMFLGQIVEEGPRERVFAAPRHSYTRRLLDAVLSPEPGAARRAPPRPSGEAPSPVRPVGDAPRRVILRDHGDGHRAAVEA